MCKQAIKVKYDFVTGIEYIPAKLPKEIAQFITRSEKDEKNYDNRVCERGWHYSLDQGDNIETAALHKPLAPPDILENNQEAISHRQETLEDAFEVAFKVLSPKQQSRIYKRFYLCLTNCEIARQEQVDESSVRESIKAALCKLADRIDFDALQKIRTPEKA